MVARALERSRLHVLRLPPVDGGIRDVIHRMAKSKEFKSHEQTQAKD